MDHVYDLNLEAYDDERLAQRAKSQAAEAFADQQIAERRRAK